jgi:transposase
MDWNACGRNWSRHNSISSIIKQTSLSIAGIWTEIKIQGFLNKKQGCQSYGHDACPQCVQKRGFKYCGPAYR